MHKPFSTPLDPTFLVNFIRIILIDLRNSFKFLTNFIAKLGITKLSSPTHGQVSQLLQLDYPAIVLISIILMLRQEYFECETLQSLFSQDCAFKTFESIKSKFLSGNALKESNETLASLSPSTFLPEIYEVIYFTKFDSSH